MCFFLTIDVVKKEYPDFKANLLTVGDFEYITKRFSERIKRFENIDIPKSEENNETVIKSKVVKNEITSTFPLNQILYGPPGTGKTYHTVLESAKIITGNEAISYDEALKIFNDNLGNQIEFITFHQNYSYEDFIQGLRPDTENGSALTFEKKDGVFKRIADRALFEYYIEIQKTKSKSVEVYLDINEVYLDFYNSLSIGQQFSTKTNKMISIVQLNENKNIVFKYGIASKPVLVSSNRLLKLFSKIPESINNL